MALMKKNMVIDHDLAKMMMAIKIIPEDSSLHPIMSMTVV
jgi:hypothetical protein